MIEMNNQTRPQKQNGTRQQLTLFIRENHETIEKVRKEFNTEQYKIISAHVTLCREDELNPVEKVISNIKNLKITKPLKITFDKVGRFEDGRGVWLPGSMVNNDFYELRTKLLKGLFDNPRQLRPHVTLMHPRNSNCTDKIFGQICKYELPTELTFHAISLIEQNSGGPWKIIDEFKI